MPIGPVRRIDEARDNVVMAIDGRPALTVFYEDIGPELARDPRRLGGVSSSVCRCPAPTPATISCAT